MASSAVFCLWYFAVVIVAAGLMRWANRLINVPIQKLHYKPGGYSQHSESAFPLLLMLGILFRPLPWLLYFLLFHRLFIPEISRYFCCSREILPQALQSQPCCAPEPFSLSMCELLGSFWIACLTGFHRCVLQEVITCLTNPQSLFKNTGVTFFQRKSS